MKKKCQKQKQSVRPAVSSGKPTVISTFAGCGGSSLGYHYAGFKELLAVEWEDNAAKTFQLNFPDVPLFHGDIKDLSVEDCLKRTGLKRGELDVFDGSPPCQGFSMAGSRKFNDPRNSLFKEYCRLLEGLQPKAFVMENVTGMVRGVMKQAFLTCISELRECGYDVKAEVMNAKYYGVPQARERVIFIGTRKDLNIPPTHPKPQTKPISVMEALRGLSNDTEEIHTPKNMAFELLKKTKPGESCSKYHPKGSYFNIQRCPANKPSCTIIKTVGTCHPFELRYLTIAEIKRIGSFPDDFKLIGKFDEKWARIGNSVPPLLMKAIAEHIKVNILKHQGAST